MGKSNTPIDKLDAYIIARDLWGELYDVRVTLNKADRITLYPYVLNLCSLISADIALAKRIKRKELHYLEKLIGDFEQLKITLREMLDKNIINSDNIKTRIFTLIGQMDDNLDKWFNYSSDIFNKKVMKAKSIRDKRRLSQES